MSHSLIIVPDLSVNKVLYFFLPSLSIFLNTKTIVLTNLKPSNKVNKSIRLLIIADSVSLSCSSVLKKFKISTL